ncbi:MAG TPA: hypothetical protein VLC94_02775 [Candidatus Acidoferrum sp.]|nr:hypothetical protein [Candidatus Acidoferrum sp.]
MPIDEKVIRPSWWYCLWILPIAGVGFGLFAYLLWTGVKEATGSLTQIVVPGEKELNLAEPGEYTIFLEEQSEVDGRIYSARGAIRGLKCTVAAQSGNEELPVRSLSSTVTYTLSRRSGRSILQFDVANAGVYKIGCAYPENAAAPQTVIAVGTGVDTRIFNTLLRSLAAFFLTFVVSLTIFLVIVARRDRCRRQLRAEARAKANTAARIAAQAPHSSAPPAV